MRWLVLVLAVVMAWPLAAQERRPSSELRGIKGDDDRVTVAADQYPWSAVGRLNNGLGGHCSGILVAPKLVATAAHCLFNRRTQKIIPVGSLTFVAGYDRGEYLKASKVARMHPAPEWKFDGGGGLARRIHDWALLELVDPLGEDVGWVALGENPKIGSRLIAVGYGRDRAHVPAIHMGCRVEAKRLGVWVTDCDAVQGGSGGPVLGWRNDAPVLLGLNVAVLLDGSEGGVAVGTDAFAATARRLGAMGKGRAGPLSRPLDRDIITLINNMNWND